MRAYPARDTNMNKPEIEGISIQKPRLYAPAHPDEEAMYRNIIKRNGTAKMRVLVHGSGEEISSAEHNGGEARDAEHDEDGDGTCTCIDIRWACRRHRFNSTRGWAEVEGAMEEPEKGWALYRQ
ncbi:hypothetical protein PENSPDRAFT_104131 [Peniophora sp. CONT]|nr:hypothetical protein PENSPDRAFT_104131 [Peniophora sp. CONT]